MPSLPDRAAATATLYVLLSLGFAWLYWLAVQLSRRGVLPFSMEHAGFFRASVPGSIIWAIVDGFGPAIAAILALAAFRGRAGLAMLWKRLTLWRVPAWLWIAGLFGILFNLAALAAGYAIGEVHYAPTLSLVRLPAMFFLMILFDGPLGEEIGWRGVLLPELLEKLHPVTASLIVGAVWYLWHVPLYAADGRTMGAAAQALFLVSCLALALLHTWFFVRSGGSVLLAMYVHNCGNFFTFLRMKTFARTGDSILPAVAAIIVLALLAIAAAVALARRYAESRACIQARSSSMGRGRLT